MFEPLHYVISVMPGTETLITLSGEMDIASAPAFEAAVANVDFSFHRRIVLDLERLDFIDASGVRVLLALHARCMKTHVALAITPGPRQVQRVFELTGTDRLLPFSRRRGPARGQLRGLPD